MLSLMCTQCGINPRYTTGGLCEDCHHTVMMASAIDPDSAPVAVNDEIGETVVRTSEELVKYAFEQRQFVNDNPKLTKALDVRERMALNIVGLQEIRKRAEHIEGVTPDGKLSARVLFGLMMELFDSIILEAGLEVPGEGFEHLKPLGEHNIMKEREYEAVKHTAILCPTCKQGELIRKTMCIDFMNDPPRVWVVCDHCNQETTIKA